MKKLKLFLIFAFLIIPNLILAKSNISVEDYYKTINVEDDGSIRVKEDISYNSDDSLNGVYLNFDYNADDITALKIKSQNNIFSKVENAQNGDKNVYTLSQNNDKTSLKIYSPFNGSLNISLTYKIKNAIIVNNEEALLKYNFITVSDDAKLRHFLGILNLNNIKIYNKLSDFDSSKLRVDNDTIRFEDINLEKNRYEILVSFDKSLVKNALISNITYDDLLTSNLEEGASFSSKDFYIPMLIISILSLIVSFLLYRKKYPQIKAIGEFLELTPAVASYFTVGPSKIENLILASILDFKRRGIIEIEESSYTNKRGKSKENFIFKLIDRNKNMSVDEKLLLETLFSFGNENEVSTKDLSESRLKSPNAYMKKFNKYTNFLNERQIELGLKYKNTSDIILSIIILIVCLIGLLLSLFFTAINDYFYIIGLLLFGISTWLSFNVLTRKPQLFKEQYSLYKGLYNDLKNGEINKDNYSDEEKEKLLIYSMAFGIKNKKIEDLSNSFGLNDYTPVLLYSAMFTSFQSSVSGGYSGFSGGSSGGTTGGF